METFPNLSFPTTYLHFLKRFPSQCCLYFSAQQLFSFESLKTFSYSHGPSLHVCVYTIQFVFYICHASQIMRQQENLGGTCSNESYYLTAVRWLLSTAELLLLQKKKKKTLHVHAFKAHMNVRVLFLLWLSVRKLISSFFWKNSWREKSACLATTLTE